MHERILKWAFDGNKCHVVKQEEEKRVFYETLNEYMWVVWIVHSAETYHVLLYSWGFFLCLVRWLAIVDANFSSFSWLVIELLVVAGQGAYRVDSLRSSHMAN